ncbi:hypothetical protein J2X92_005049 [Variovorax paradoxus]|nr:hypothetical protein [Variovorax paradoxus]
MYCKGPAMPHRTALETSVRPGTSRRRMALFATGCFLFASAPIARAQAEASVANRTATIVRPGTETRQVLF